MTKTFQSSQISLCANTNSIGRETVLGCQRSLRKKAEQGLINNQFSNASMTSGNNSKKICGMIGFIKAALQSD